MLGHLLYSHSPQKTFRELALGCAQMMTPPHPTLGQDEKSSGNCLQNYVNVLNNTKPYA